MKANPEVTIEIINLLKDFSKAVENRDIDAVMKLFATDADIVSVGSEERETAVGPEEYRKFLIRAFSRPVSFSWDWGWTLVSARDNNVAWVTAEGFVITRKVGNTIETRSPYRLSAVFERRNDRWFWMSYHGSEPAKKKVYGFRKASCVTKH